MKNATTVRTAGILGVVLCLAGVVLSADMLRTFNDRLERMTLREQQMAELDRLAATSAELDGLLRAVEPYAESRAGALAALKERALPGEAGEVRERERVTLIDGWTGRQADVQLKNVPMGGVMRFVRMAERERLPWRLRSCTIRASRGRAGTGDATLVMETIERVN